VQPAGEAEMAGEVSASGAEQVENGLLGQHFKRSLARHIRKGVSVVSST
jgi:hypothetical protein